MSKVMNELWRVATRLPGTEEGVACAGTALERRTAKVAKKAFLFLGQGDVMLKLEASLVAARALAAKAAGRLRVGDNGWVKITFTDEEPPPKVVTTTWIAESHALMSRSNKPAAKKTSKKTSAVKKKTTPPKKR